jgi:hypothetical protein
VILSASGPRAGARASASQPARASPDCERTFVENARALRAKRATEAIFSL